MIRNFAFFLLIFFSLCPFQIQGEVLHPSNGDSEIQPTYFVTLKIYNSHGTGFTVTQPEGEAFLLSAEFFEVTVTLLRSGRDIGINLHQSLARSSMQTSKMDKIIAPAASITKLAQLNERFSLPSMRLNLEVVSVDKVQAPNYCSFAKIPSVGKTAVKNQCCVTCNGIRVCGCAVVASCGSCCVGVCCK
jgi:hypothetical protein